MCGLVAPEELRYLFARAKGRTRLSLEALPSSLDWLYGFWEVRKSYAKMYVSLLPIVVTRLNRAADIVVGPCVVDRDCVAGD